MKKLTNKKQLFIILAVVTLLCAISSNVFAVVPISITTPDTTGTTSTTGTATTSYIVTFNTNGGSTIQSQTITSGNTATRPASNPTKEGYTFDDWYADASFLTKYDFTQPVTSSITIYAKWNASSTATPTSSVVPTVNTNTTSGDDSLPQTGDAEDYLVFALIGISAIVATVAFVKAKKYNLK